MQHRQVRLILAGDRKGILQSVRRVRGEVGGNHDPPEGDVGAPMLLGGGNHEHRDAAVVQYAFGGRSHDPALKAPMAVGSHGNQIGLVGVQRAANLCGGIASFYFDIDLDVLTGQTAFLEQLPDLSL